ncbi:hypothetical protein [Chitinibacter sp. GC72]|uniref:hypothetical protein n=1 Tax=Chitinibacter sp. GC72 TaxID=1526917 RepID=UPI0012F762F5|nr:hypothetical protein [Chitinibacter sp. GC72]
MKTIVLFLTHEVVSAYGWGEQGALPLAFFPHNELGISDFREWIIRHASLSYCIVTDLVEEDFQHEMIPHLSGKDRLTLCERKLAQHFRATPYRRASVLPAARRGEQDSLQLSALIQPDALARILADLAVVKAAVVGVYSVALLTQIMLSQLNFGQPCALVMSCNAPGQLRQSYFTPEGLRFSRLATFRAQQDTHANRMAGEIIRARQYLMTQHLLRHDETLHILAFFDAALAPMHAEVLLALGDVAELVQINMQADIGDLAARLGLPKTCHHWCDLLVAMLVVRGVPNQYASAKVMKYHRLNILGRRVLLGAIAGLACACILALILLWQVLDGHRQLALGQQVGQALEQQRRQLARNLAQSPLSAAEAGQLEQVMQLQRDHLQSAPRFEPTLRRLSHVLQALPGVSISEVRWLTGQYGVQAQGENAEPNSADPVAWRDQTLLISGRVPNRLAYRAAIGEVEALVLALQRWPEATVIVEQWPLDTSPAASVQPAAATQRGAQAIKPDFIIRVQLVFKAIASKEGA